MRLQAGSKPHGMRAHEGDRGVLPGGKREVGGVPEGEGQEGPAPAPLAQVCSRRGVLSSHHTLCPSPSQDWLWAEGVGAAETHWADVCVPQADLGRGSDQGGFQLPASGTVGKSIPVASSPLTCHSGPGKLIR